MSSAHLPRKPTDTDDGSASNRPPIPARQALFPSRFESSSRNRINHAQTINAIGMAAQKVASGRLIDIGCGIKPYEPMFAPYVTEHVGVDHESSVHFSDAIDVIGTAYDVPLPDETFDTALMSEVLEHLEEPKDALHETRRLLRPGGWLILSTPMLWQLHEEPRDFYRYTPYGLEHLLLSSGFREVEVTPLAGQWTSLALISGYALQRTRLGRTPRLLESYWRSASWLSVRMDERDFRPWLSWSHVAVAMRAE